MNGRDRKSRRLLGALQAGKRHGQRLARHDGAWNLGERLDDGDIDGRLEQVRSSVDAWPAPCAQPDPTILQRELALKTCRAVLDCLPGDAPAADEARTLEARILDWDEAAYGPLRGEVRRKERTPQALRAKLERLPSNVGDAFMDRLLGIHAPVRPSRQADADHVTFVPSPVQQPLFVADRLTADDVLIDLGCGTGKVCMTLALFGPARIRGLDYDPVLVRAAERASGALGLRVDWKVEDAQRVDLTDVTAIFMFEPFRGPILHAVLERIRQHSLATPTRLWAHFKTHRPLESIEWLDPVAEGPQGLVEYRTLPPAPRGPRVG